MSEQATDFRPERATSLAQAQQMLQRAEADRIVHWFTVPEGIVKLTGIKRIGMIELTAGEEMMATERARMNPIRLAFELAKEAVRYVDAGEGTPRKINTGDGSSDAFWGARRPGMPKLRQLCLTAYGEIHTPDAEDVVGFLASHTQMSG